jgi:hypothetical protein
MRRRDDARIELCGAGFAFSRSGDPCRFGGFRRDQSRVGGRCGGSVAARAFNGCRENFALSIEPIDVRHLDLLPFAPRRHVGLGPGDVACDVTGVLVDGARDFAGGRVRTTTWLKLAGVAVTLVAR